MEAALDREPESGRGLSAARNRDGRALGREQLMIAPLKSLPRPSILDAPITKLAGRGRSWRPRRRRWGSRPRRPAPAHPARLPGPRRPGWAGRPEAGRGGDGGGRGRRAKLRPTRRRRLTILEADVCDASGKAKAVWFNRAWLADRLQPGTACCCAASSRSAASTSPSTSSWTRGARPAGLHTTGHRPGPPGERAAAPAADPRVGLAGDPAGAPRGRADPGRLRRELRMAGAADSLVASHFPAGRARRRGRPGAPRLRGALPLPGGARLAAGPPSLRRARHRAARAAGSRSRPGSTRSPSS